MTLKFAANLSFLFKELPFLERFAEARIAGFTAVEVLFPYDVPASEIKDRLLRNDLDLVLINTPPPNWTGGDRGFAAVIGGQDRFRHDFKRAMRFADMLGAQHLHIMSGCAEGPVAKATFVENLKWATTLAADQSLTIEPINSHDMPGYYLNDFDLAAEILDAVNAPNLALQFDAYHAYHITGDTLETWATHGHRARHIQIAGALNRHEPVKGDIDYPAFFARIKADGYAGYVSGEYHPKGRTEDGLNWLKTP